MVDKNVRLDSTVAGDPVYRRSIRREDQRWVHLYGYAENRSPVVSQDPEDLPRGAELRWHPLRQEWNIYAAHRQNRTFKPSAANNPLAPSLPGRPVTEIPVENFELAVFDNRFTSLHFEASAVTDVADVKLRPAKGQCEVVVYGTEADGDLNTIGQARRRLLLAAWIDRYQALFDAGCEFVLPFENRGEDVGVTLHHPHGQIYGFDHLPPAQARAEQAFAGGYSLTDALAQLDPRLVVEEADALVSYCPPYARFPYETWIASRVPRPGPWAMSESELDAFASLLGDMTRRYDQFFGQTTPYMLALHAAPRDREHFEFSAQFYPLLRGPGRLKYLASVEQHTGVFTVDVLPESAAQVLRSAV
ncbi:MAG: galactose-1-phosphate uridylyltransferase [Pseudomonadota bacterium]